MIGHGNLSVRFCVLIIWRPLLATHSRLATEVGPYSENGELAKEFISKGWSLKAAARSVVFHTSFATDGGSGARNGLSPPLTASTELLFTVLSLDFSTAAILGP